jgi:lipopolysaccharide assembly outer membrane protein LptD (OstA)
VNGRGLAALGLAALALAAASRVCAQFGGGFGAFDTVHAGAITSNDRTGDFSIPGRFSASRQGTEIDGDRAQGNAGTKQVVVDGNVVVHFSKPLVVVGGGPAASGPSTLTCDQLQIDGARQVYHAIGHVHYLAAGRETTSDRAELDGATNLLHLEGRIAISAAGGQNGVGGFDTIKAATIDSDAVSGNFTIPGHFTATREGLEIAGDHAKGNSVSKQVSITGNVVVTMRAGNAMKETPAPSPTASPQVSTLTCDRLDIDGVHRVYHAIGNVHYHEPTRDITADRADMTEATSHIHLEGNVHVTDNGQSSAS